MVDVDSIESSSEVTRASGPVRTTGLIDPTARIEPPPEESLTGLARVGRYHIEARIGAGGMGVVLRARDPELGRVVAIKLLRSRRYQSRDATKRLLREAQAMARLSHPNVIEIYDVGEVDGRVFIAMEHVAGQTLKEWIRRASPSRRAVLDAFVQAGRGLAAAHRVGLVHRDFKPTNVLRGEDGRVRVLDFGLATPPRRGSPRLSSVDDGSVLLETRVTATGLIMGTPAYMAPECHEDELIDARSDQFSFCVSLYEALYGERPFPGPSAEEIAEQSARGIIQLPPGATVPAGLRDAVLRGLLPDPAQRWPSMEALLEHLRPPRRSRWPWAAGLAVVGAGALALALGLPASSPPSTCEREAQAVHEVWNEDAGARLREAFVAAGVSYAEDAAPRVRTRLDAYASALAEARRQACEAAVDRPDPRAACLDERLAELRGLVSVLEQAEPAAVRNAVAATSELGTVESCEQASSSSVAPPPAELVPEVRRVREELGRIRARLAAGSYESALELADQALSRAEALGYEPLLAEAQYLRGRALEGSGEYAAAEALLLEAQLRAEAAGHDELSATVAVRLVFVMSQLGRNEDAERWARHARAAVGRLPPGHPAGLQLESTLGALRWSQGRLEEAREHYERALEARAAELGDEHPSTLILRAHLATLCHEMGDQARAHDLMRSALDDQLEVLGPSHPEVSAAYGNLGVIELAQGELEASVAHTRTALEGLRSTVGELHPHYPRLLTNLAEAELALGQLEEARQHQQRALELFEQTLGPRSVEVGHANINLGAIHHEQGRFAEARAAYRRGLEIWQEHLRPDHPELAIAIVDIALADLELGHPEEAIAGFDRALALLGAARGDEHPSLAASLVGRGRAWLERGQPQRARADLERALRLREAEDGDPTRRGEARFRLGQAQWATGEHQAAMLSVEQARSEIAPRAGPRLREELDAWLAEHGPLAATSE